MDSLAYTAGDELYGNLVAGNCDGTNGAATGPAVSMGAGETDPRVNAFIEDPGGSATPAVKVDITNRNGAWGSAGTGTHYVTDGPIPVSASLPTAKPGLTSVANPRATISYSHLLYMIDADYPRIQAVEMVNYTIVTFLNNRPAYTFTSTATVNCGADLEVVVEKDDQGNDVTYFYALFNSGSTFSGPWVNSTVVRLAIDESGSPRGRLVASGQAQAGVNAVGMGQVKYTLAGAESAKTYLLVVAIGGIQNSGSGNGSNSVVSVIETGTGINKIADAVVGTFALTGTSLTLDLKSIAITPSDDNDAYVWIQGASYDSSNHTNWTVRETKASVIIEKAKAIQDGQGQDPPVTVPPLNLGSFAKTIDEDTATPGYFWALAFSSSGTGVSGKLYVARGDSSGDMLKVYDTNSTGVIDPDNPVTIGSSKLYGSSGCNLNSICLVPSSAAVLTKIHHPSPPPTAARASVSAATVSADAAPDEND